MTFFPDDVDLHPFPAECIYHSGMEYGNVAGIASFRHVYPLQQLNSTLMLHAMAQTSLQM